MEIEEPLTLVKLPQSNVKGGRTIFAPVHSIQNGLKRRRHEFCAAIDGDSVNIYEINDGRTLSSYALPPDSILSCAPCSLRISTKTGRKHRRTYFITQRRNETLICLLEDDLSNDLQRPTSKTLPISLGQQAVIQLEIVITQDTYTILAVLGNGHCITYDADLSCQPRKGQLCGIPDGHRLLAVQWLSRKHALKSILKSRPDVFAIVEPNSSFLLGIFSPMTPASNSIENFVGIGVWPVQQATVQSSSASSSDLVLQHKLSIASPLVNQEHDPVVLSCRASRLIVRTQTTVLVFNLALVTPCQIQDTPASTIGLISSIYISDTLTLLATPTTIQLYNTHFHAPQLKLDLSTRSLKRKRGMGSSGPIHLLTFFPALSRVLGKRGDSLIAIDLRAVQDGDVSEAIRHTALLSNNLGKGSRFHTGREQVQPGHVGKSDIEWLSVQDVQEWHRTIKLLEKSLQAQAYDEFQSKLLATVAEHEETSPVDPRSLLSFKIDYMISKLFTYGAPAESVSPSIHGGLRLNHPCHRLLRYLAVEGHLTVDRITTVLATSIALSTDSIRFGSIAHIIIESDQSLDLLEVYLREAPYIDQRELCTVILLLVQCILKDVNETIMTDQNSHANTLTIMGTTGSDSRVNENEVASVHVTARLYMAIERLSKTTQKTLSVFMRKVFTQREVIALLQLLRQQLYWSGYTSVLRTNQNPSPSASDTGVVGALDQRNSNKGQLSLDAVTFTLSSCVDAIGPRGALGLGDEEEFLQGVIPELSSEIAKATEAIQDAIFVEGVLRETLRFIELTKQKNSSAPQLQHKNNIHKAVSDRILTLFTEPEVDEGLEFFSGALPLGSRQEDVISTVRVKTSDGTVSKKSVREIGELQDRLRGPYSLERLVL